MKKMSKPKEYTSKISEELFQEMAEKEWENTEKRMLLAARIDEAIKRKGWSKKRFAYEIDKSPSEISKWLSGTHNFTTETLWEIENLLNIRLINLGHEDNKAEIANLKLITTSTHVRILNRKENLPTSYDEEFSFPPITIPTSNESSKQHYQA